MVARQISLALKKLVRLCLQTRISCLIKLSNFLYVHRSNPQQSVRSLQPKNVTVIIKPITYLIVDLHCTSCLIERINTVTIITPPSGRGLVIPIFFRGFFFFFLVVTCPRPPVFARPNKYSSCLSLHRQGLLSWVTVTYFTPPGGGRTTAGSNAPGAFLVLLKCLQKLKKLIQK